MQIKMFFRAQHRMLETRVLHPETNKEIKAKMIKGSRKFFL